MKDDLEAIPMAEHVADSDGESTTLRAAYLEKQAPNKPGVYKMYHDGKLMKVGKAEDGLRKRFSDYYRGQKGGTAGSRYVNESNRDEIEVWWVCLPRDKCREAERNMTQQAIDGDEKLPWVVRMP